METTAIARKLTLPIVNPLEIETLLLNRLAVVGQKALAEYRQVSESAVSRWKSDGYFRDIANVLAFLGVQAASTDAVMVSRDYLLSVETLADIGLQAQRFQFEQHQCGFEGTNALTVNHYQRVSHN